MTNYVTKTEIVKNFEGKIKNVYQAHIISIFDSSIMLSIENSDALITVSRECVSYMRIYRNLNELFAVSDEIFPVTVTGYKYTDEGEIYLYGSLLPAWGTLEDVRTKMGSEVKTLPVIAEGVNTSDAVAVSPNIVSLCENTGLGYYSAVEASIYKITERGKVRLDIMNRLDDIEVSRVDCIKALFDTYHKDITELPDFIDIAEFIEELKIKPAVRVNNIKPSTPVNLFNPEVSLAYPQPQKPYNRYYLQGTINRITSNPDTLRTLTNASKLFHGFFTPEMLKAIEGDVANSDIDTSLIGLLVSNNILCSTKIASEGVRTLQVYTNSINFRHIMANGVSPLAVQNSTDVDYILREVSVSQMLIKMFKENPAILDELKRSWMLSAAPFSDRTACKFRATALLTESKIVFDSCRGDQEAIDKAINKVQRMSQTFKELGETGYKVYITCRDDKTEKALRDELSKLSTENLKIFTTTDEKFRDNMHLEEVIQLKKQKTSLFSSLTRFIATF